MRKSFALTAFFVLFTTVALSGCSGTPTEKPLIQEFPDQTPLGGIVVEISPPIIGTGLVVIQYRSANGDPPSLFTRGALAAASDGIGIGDRVTTRLIDYYITPYDGMPVFVATKRNP